MTADPGGFGGGTDTGEWGLDEDGNGVTEGIELFLMGVGPRGDQLTENHGSGMANTPAWSDVDYAYNLWTFGEGNSAAHPPVPEPATLGLLLLGGLLVLRRRR